jgi:hypothetical protein
MRYKIKNGEMYVLQGVVWVLADLLAQFGVNHHA